MSRNFIFLLLSIFHIGNLSSQKSETIHCPLGIDWELDSTFSDEFTVHKLDNDKWWDFNPAWVGRKPAYFARENVKIKKGVLELTARNQDPKKVSVENKARGLDKFTTALVKSKKRIKYGYFEARCKSMRANVCNAFWLYDPLDPPQKYVEGNFSEEIDIFEIFGKPGKQEYNRVFWATLHRHETPYVESIVNKKKTKLPDYSKTVKMPYDFYDDFHIYGFLWTPDTLKWFVDGEVVFERKNDYFTNPLHIVFDAEIMETWMGLPDTKDLPSTFYIDYIRVWKNKKFEE
ncbi:MAG: family 16 glycosylhydrolase [Saprospiraceae bacterium]